MDTDATDFLGRQGYAIRSIDSKSGGGTEFIFDPDTAELLAQREFINDARRSRSWGAGCHHRPHLSQVGLTSGSGDASSIVHGVAEAHLHRDRRGPAAGSSVPRTQPCHRSERRPSSPTAAPR